MSAYEREAALWEAYRAGDRERLEALVHPDALDVGTGGALTRAQVLDTVARMRIDSYTIDDLVARRFGDVEIVTYAATVEGTYRGAPFTHPMVFATSVWALDAGAWRLVHRVECPAARTD